MQRFNTGKPPVSLLPTALIQHSWKNGHRLPTVFLEEVAQVLGYGSRKYDANNWRKSGPWLEVLDCGLRHLNKIIRGETHDDESGIHHAGHVGCNIGFLLEFIAQSSGVDNRYKVTTVFGDIIPEDSDAISRVYNKLLMWKDGGDHSCLHEAVQILSTWFESLPEKERAHVPGTSPYAPISKVNPNAKLS